MERRAARSLVLSGLAVLALSPVPALWWGDVARGLAAAWPPFLVFALLVALAAWLVLRGRRMAGGLGAAALVVPAFLLFFWMPWVALAPLLVAAAAPFSRAAPSARRAPRA